MTGTTPAPDQDALVVTGTKPNKAPTGFAKGMSCDNTVHKTTITYSIIY